MNFANEYYKMIKSNWEQIQENIANTALANGRNPDTIKVIAVSKTHNPELIKTALEIGISRFGENYVQELTSKYEYFKNSDLKPEWHFIGHLQTNKVKFIIPFISMIHTVDSVKLAGEINKWAEKNNRTIDILVQVNTSGEQSKYGCEPDFTVELVREIKDFPRLKILGLMTIGTFSDDEKIIRREFRLLSKLLNDVNQELGLNLKELSMGMTHDYMIAIEEGATYLRIGTAIFGERYY